MENSKPYNIPKQTVMMAYNIERWLKAPFQTKTGETILRTAGTPQGGVISPILANLFMHYAFDLWMARNHKKNPFERYADDTVVHCRTEQEAKQLRVRIDERLKGCKLELHPTKTKIVYCQDKDRRKEYSHTEFDFLGYTFWKRWIKDRLGRVQANFIDREQESGTDAEGQDKSLGNTQKNRQ